MPFQEKYPLYERIRQDGDLDPVLYIAICRRIFGLSYVNTGSF